MRTFFALLTVLCCVSFERASADVTDDRGPISSTDAMISAQILYYKQTSYFSSPDDRGGVGEIARDLETISKFGLKSTAAHSLNHLIPQQLSLQIETYYSGVRPFIEAVRSASAPETKKSHFRVTRELNIGDIEALDPVIRAVNAQFPGVKFTADVRSADSDREFQVIVDIDKYSFVPVLRAAFANRIRRISSYDDQMARIDPPSFFKEVDPIVRAVPQPGGDNAVYGYFLRAKGFEGARGEGSYVYYEATGYGDSRKVTRLSARSLGATTGSCETLF